MKAQVMKRSFGQKCYNGDICQEKRGQIDSEHESQVFARCLKILLNNMPYTAWILNWKKAQYSETGIWVSQISMLIGACYWAQASTILWISHTIYFTASSSFDTWTRVASNEAGTKIATIVALSATIAPFWIQSTGRDNNNNCSIPPTHLQTFDYVRFYCH